MTTAEFNKRARIIILAVVILIVVAWGASKLRKKQDEDTGEIDYSKDTSKPRGIRNNNPGNIKIADGNKWKGKIPRAENTDGTFEQFTEYRYGIRAMILLLIFYMQNGYDNLDKIIKRYTSGDSAAVQAQYIAYVSSAAGISPTKYLQPTKGTLRDLVIAMTHFENNADAVTNAQFDAGYKEAFS